MASLNVDSPSVQSHLAMLQGVIARMAGNSANCKTWCVGLVSALVVVVADKEKPSLLIAAAVPVVIFLVLDAYYLALERRFRHSYEGFVRRLHDGEATIDDVFVLWRTTARWKSLVAVLAGLLSFSVWPFYITLAVLVRLIAWRLLATA
jgi:hypothetical protein